jgi:hypothetical protein
MPNDKNAKNNLLADYLGAGLTGLAQSNPVKATAELRLEPLPAKICANCRGCSPRYCGGATSTSRSILDKPDLGDAAAIATVLA